MLENWTKIIFKHWYYQTRGKPMVFKKLEAEIIDGMEKEKDYFVYKIRFLKPESDLFEWVDWRTFSDKYEEKAIHDFEIIKVLSK